MRSLPTLALLVVLPLVACERVVPGAPAPTPEVYLDPLTLTTDSLVERVDSLRLNFRMVFPQVEGDAPSVVAVNAAIRDSAQALLDVVRPTEAPASDFPGGFTEVDGGPQVSRLEGGVLSALLGIYAYTGGAHGNTLYIPLNFDVETGEPVYIDDVFAPGTAYLDTLSALTLTGLVAEAEARGMGGGDSDVRSVFWESGYAPEVRNFRTFTLGPDSLHLHFEPYAVASYAAGPFHVAIPYRRLGSLLAPGGPAARIAAAE